MVRYRYDIKSEEFTVGGMPPLAIKSAENWQGSAEACLFFAQGNMDPERFREGAGGGGRRSAAWLAFHRARLTRPGPTTGLPSWLGWHSAMEGVGGGFGGGGEWGWGGRRTTPCRRVLNRTRQGLPSHAALSFCENSGGAPPPPQGA